MKQKDYKKFMSLHEFTLRFNHNNIGNNFDAAQLCHLDNTVINDLLKEGYRPSDIMKHVGKVFKGGKKRYNILKKFIEDFDKNKMKKITFKQSKNWWQSKDLNWFIENADFAFTNNGYKGNRVRIVTKEKLNGMNCFEFDNDRYGIMITSETEFSKGLGETIVDSTKDVVPMLVKFLNEWGAGEFVNPKINFRHIISTIKKNHKSITITKN